MIRPEEVKSKDKNQACSRRLASLEADFDEAIRKADQTGVWPALVPNLRDGAIQEEIQATCLKYREAGWEVVAIPGFRAGILRPKA